MNYRSSKPKSAKSKNSSKRSFSNKLSKTNKFKSYSFDKPSYSRPQKARVIKKFDPSIFIKKVEEQTLEQPYIPKNIFANFDIPEKLKQNIVNKNYVNPTPIQDEAIPAILENKDIIATANTGTGKTAAFLIPLISNILNKKNKRALIIAPTRELADQIQDEFKSFAKGTGLYSVLCIGGANMIYQINGIKRNPDVVIGTPGRLIDLQENNHINFRQYDTIVLDEVDRMLDMGFIKSIKTIISSLPKKRHSLFFSATIPDNVKTLMNQFLNNPQLISVKARQSSENVNQQVIKVGNKEKIEVLHDLLIKPEVTKNIIFLRTKRSVDRLARSLKERGFGVSAIHGDKTQGQRNRALASFKLNKINILLATDVVARGIDINDISHVINYDLPESNEDYIHRIGRTGRAGKIGQAITFID